MRITFLGTNGWYSSDMGNTVSILIETKKFYIILDAGDSLNKIDKYIKDAKPILIFLSHLHLDHIIGFHAFAKFRFNQIINIYGLSGTKKGIEFIIKHPYSSPFADLSLKIKFHDLQEGTHNVGFPMTCKLLTHADPCLGYRFEIENKIITYCTDTGICPNLYELAQNADVFISECSYKSGQEVWGWPHLKPEEAAEVAVKSEVKKLFLTHFDASTYTTIKERKEAEKIAKKIFSNTIAAYDDLEIVIE